MEKDDRRNIFNDIAKIKKEVEELTDSNNNFGSDTKEILVKTKFAEIGLLIKDVDKTIKDYRVEQNKGGFGSEDDISSILFKNSADKLENEEKPSLIKLQDKLRKLG